MSKGLVLSLYDFTGNWAKPWAEDGFDVILADLKHGINVLTMDMDELLGKVNVLLAAPPCTDFAVSGARWWKDKDEKGQTKESLMLVAAALVMVDVFRPKVWCIENPVGRLPKFGLGKPNYTFNPCDFAYYAPDPEKDAYTKRTCLWGKFNMPEKKPIEPIIYTSKDGKKKGSYMWAKLGGKSERTKELRSATPLGFAYAFWEANKNAAIT